MLPEHQDEYLDLGYFRSGHTIRRTRFIFVDGKIWSTVWSRVPVHTYKLRNSQRKIVRRVERQFEITVAPYTRQEDQDRVYHLYQQRHPLDVGVTVDDVFGHHEPTHSFNTWCLRIHDQGELIAFSCFDRGEDSIASLFGCYLPAYAKHSLGIYTMLAELAFAKTQNISYYHPGYCVPGLPAFSYKLRLPDLEGKSFVVNNWQAMHAILSSALPHEQLSVKVEELSQILAAHSIPHRKQFVPLSELGGSNQDSYGAMPEPLMLELTAGTPLGEVFIGYSLEEKRFEAWFGQMVADLQFEPDFDELRAQIPQNSNLRLYEWRTLLFAANDAEILVSYLQPQPLIEQILKLLPFWAINNPSNNEES